MNVSPSTSPTPDSCCAAIVSWTRCAGQVATASHPLQRRRRLLAFGRPIVEVVAALLSQWAGGPKPLRERSLAVAALVADCAGFVVADKICVVAADDVVVKALADMAVLACNVVAAATGLQ